MKNFDLRDLDAFVAVARTRNFRRAAVEQGVSVSSLSQRLRDMEERLGVRLMNRTTRSVALTEAGELLLARVGSGHVGCRRRRWIRCAACARCRRAVCASMRRRRRSIWCWRRWSRRFLRPIRRIDLEIVGESAFVDIVAGGFDAGVRYGEHLAQDMIAVPLERRRSATRWSPRREYVAQPRHAEASEGSARPCLHPHPLRAASCWIWEFEKAGQW